MAIQDQVPQAPVEGIIRVSGSSNPQSVGSVLARSVIAGHTPKLRAVGASAVNQAAKGIAVARGFCAPRGLDLLVTVGFDDIEGENGQTISAIFFKPVVR